MGRMARLREALRRPEAEEQRLARERRWARLPEALRRPHQWLGRMSPGCHATHQIYEACDFGCTACYLAETANRTPPLPFEEVQGQLQRVRAEAGPGGNIQLTAGEVTLMPVEDLARVVREARDLELDPMVMSNGQTFERDPEYLPALMRAGLRKLSVHIDSTQRGRRSVSKVPTERELMSTRADFAQRVRDARTRTGLPLHASHTITVTPQNLAHIPMITQWALRNADAFRMLALIPTAEVGRTRGVKAVRDADAVHDQVCAGVGRPLNRSTFLFGHPDCNRISLMWVVRFGEQVRVVEITRAGEAVDERFFEQLMSGDFQGFSLDDADGLEKVARLLGLVGRSPKYLWQWPAYAAYRLAPELRWFPRFAAAWLRGEVCWVRPFAVVIHNFMSTDEIHTRSGRARLDACAFRVPVEGRMVSMCELNATDMRRDLNLETQARLVSVGEPRAGLGVR